MPERTLSTTMPTAGILPLTPAIACQIVPDCDRATAQIPEMISWVVAVHEDPLIKGDSKTDRVIVVPLASWAAPMAPEAMFPDWTTAFPRTNDPMVPDAITPAPEEWGAMIACSSRVSP